MMLVYVQTVSVILGVFPTLPATLVSGISANNNSSHSNKKKTKKEQKKTMKKKKRNENN